MNDLRDVSLYSVYLVAERLRTIIAELPESRREPRFEIRAGRQEGGEMYLYQHIATFFSPSDSPEETEAVAATMLARIPGAQLVRSDGNIRLYGQWSNGVTWWWSMGYGVCERVQVGTRTVREPAPDAVMIEVEQPVFQYRCPDPIVAAGL